MSDTSCRVFSIVSMPTRHTHSRLAAIIACGALHCNNDGLDAAAELTCSMKVNSEIPLPNEKTLQANVHNVKTVRRQFCLSMCDRLPTTRLPVQAAPRTCQPPARRPAAAPAHRRDRAAPCPQPPPPPLPFAAARTEAMRAMVPAQMTTAPTAARTVGTSWKIKALPSAPQMTDR